MRCAGWTLMALLAAASLGCTQSVRSPDYPAEAELGEKYRVGATFCSSLELEAREDHATKAGWAQALAVASAAVGAAGGLVMAASLASEDDDPSSEGMVTSGALGAGSVAALVGSLVLASSSSSAGEAAQEANMAMRGTGDRRKYDDCLLVKAIWLGANYTPPSKNVDRSAAPTEPLPSPPPAR